MPELRLTGLRIQAGPRTLVDGVGLVLGRGELVGLVGESGSGKTMTARACLGLVEARPGIVAGDLVVDTGEERVVALRSGVASAEAFGAVRGRFVGWLPQQARESMDPLRTLGRQLRDVARLPGAASGSPEEWLARAGLPSPATFVGRYPHELSGGQAQRATVALALARGSRFLLADEPTTGLDPTVQVGVLDRLRELADEGHGVLLISHDLRQVQRVADRILVMHGGRLVEELRPGELLAARSPAARALVDATPGMGARP
ncbi:MAG: ABC transporter ATP-binding protein [Alphaproteobacteria bacterium]|nr:ABC transporter ATP-binding protein [Alphaproteobacteria bacterium]